MDKLKKLIEIRDTLNRREESPKLKKAVDNLLEAIGRRDRSAVRNSFVNVREFSLSEADEELARRIRSKLRAISSKNWWAGIEYSAERLRDLVENNFRTPFEELENLHDTLLDERKKSDSRSLEKSIEHIENSLSFSDSNINKAVRELQSAIINLRRYKKGLGISEVVLFSDDEVQRFYEWIREVQSFTREEAEDKFDISESQFFRLLRKIRKKAGVSAEDRGSNPSIFHYEGRLEGS